MELVEVRVAVHWDQSPLVFVEEAGWLGLVAGLATNR
jgi:hypothetical protein